MSSDGVSADTGSSRSAYVNGSIWALGGLASTFLSLRIYCKLRRRRGLWWDDYLLFLSWILLLVSAISTTIAVRNGFGDHFGSINPANIELLNILGLLSGFSSYLSMVVSRTSFAVTLVRLSDGWLRRFVWAIVVSVNLLSPICAFVLFDSCKPTAKLWKPSLEGKCWSLQVTVILGIVFGSYMAFCDVVLALLPWRILMRFQMYRREKLSVAIAMSMGIFTCATAIVKCIKLHLLMSSDFTFDGVPFAVWAFAECAVSIMAACIPAMRALVMDVCDPRPPCRMFRSLVISHAQESSASNGTTLTTPSTSAGGSNAGTAGCAVAKSPSSMPGVPPPTYDGNQEGQSNRVILEHSNLSTSDATIVETAEAGQYIMDARIELGEAQRDSHQLEQV